MRTLVVGDIHGAYKALLQCFERSGFDREKDRLIALGDVCDVYPEVCECVDELIALRNCDFIIGNHDLWALDWATRGLKPKMWLEQGGEQTIFSYAGSPMPSKHIDFFNKARPWLEVDGCAFVHAGFDPDRPLGAQSVAILAWDRELVLRAMEDEKAGRRGSFGCYKEIYLGHTPADASHKTVPLHICNIWALDTGAGWGGPLTIMDVHTKEYWQSDPTLVLYGPSGRRKGRG